MKSKRLFFLLLSLLIVIGLVPVSVSAAGESAGEIAFEEAPRYESEFGHTMVAEVLDPSTYPESDHGSIKRGYTDFEFSYPGAAMLTIVFSDECEMSWLDSVLICDENDSRYGYLSDHSIKGAEVVVSADYFKLRYYSESGGWYGFKIDSITAELPKHEGAAAGTAKAPTCTEDGYKAGFICDRCGKDIHGETVKATGHSYVGEVVQPTDDAFGYTLYACSGCGDSYKGRYRAPEPSYQDDINDTMSWIMKDGVLYILGVGEMPDEWINYKNWMNQESITSIVISEGITRIGDGAFVHEDKVTDVSIPSTVTSIGSTAFCNMTSLKSVTLPEGLESIGNSAFSGSGITSIEIPDSVTEIGVAAFSRCYNLAEAALGYDRTEIPEKLFSENTALERVLISPKVSMIHEEAFAGCTKLSEVVFAEKFDEYDEYDDKEYLTIDARAFANCNLVEVRLPAHLKKVSGSAFAGNTSLAVVHADTTGSPYYNAERYKTDEYGCVYEFSYDYSTGEYSIPERLVIVPGGISGEYTVKEGVIKIDAALTDLPNLTAFTFDTNSTGEAFEEDDIFENCPNLVSVNVTGSIYEGDKDYYFNGTQGDLFYTRNAGKNAWLLFIPTNATEYTVPANMSSIESFEGSFGQADLLQNIYVEEGNTIYKSDDGILYIRNELQAYPNGRTDKRITVPEWVESIRSGAVTNKNITEFYFKGDLVRPYYDELAAKKITVWYPADNETWTPEEIESTIKGYEGNHGIKLTFKPYGDVKVEAPEIKATTTASTGYPKVKWDKVTGAEKYEVYRATSKSGTYKLVKTTTSASYTDKKATVGKKYYYKVIAVAKNGKKSGYSNIVNRTGKIACPEISVTNLYTGGKPKVTWDKVEGAKGYKVYRAVDQTGVFNKVSETKGTTYTDKGAGPGIIYQYKVKAIHSNSSANSEYSDVEGSICTLESPDVKESNVTSSGKIKLKWSKIDDAKSYMIYRSTSKTGEYKNIAETTKTSYTDKSAKAGKVYYYKLVAVHANDSANSQESEPVGQTCKLERPDVEESNVSSSGKIKLEWKKISGTKVYKIYRATSKDGKFTKIAETEKTSYTDKTAKAGKVYYYKVKAIHSKSAANSAYSSVVGQTCKLERPDVSVKLSSGKPKLKWDEVDGASKYEVYRATSKSGTYKLVKTTTSKSYTDKSAKKGKTYYYKVKAVYKKSTANSAYSSVDSIKATK